MTDTTRLYMVWASCYSDRDRLEYIRLHPDQFDFRDYAEVIAVVRGRYFIGCDADLLA